MTSPCGANCSYVMEFEGPWVECTNATETFFINDTLSRIPIYSGQWLAPPVAYPGFRPKYNGTYTLANFSSTTLVPLMANRAIFEGEANSSLFVQQNTIICSPGRASFRVNNTYHNNLYRRSVTVKPIDKLINLALTTYNGAVKVPGINREVGYGFGATPANWSSEALAYYRDQNMMTIFSAMLSWLNGNFVATAGTSDALTGNNATTITNLHWKESITTLRSGLAMRDSGTYQKFHSIHSVY